MSETAARIRQPIDLEEFERRLRAGVPAAAKPEHDPLAELARLVGQDDPFRSITSQTVRPRAPVVRLHPERFPEPAAPRDLDEFEQHPSFAPAVSAVHVEEAQEIAPHEYGEVSAIDDSFELRGPIFEETPEDWSEPQPNPLYSEARHEDYSALPPEADGAHVSHAALPDRVADEEPPRRSVRGVILLLAILGAGVVGFGATTGVKPSLFALAGRSPPVILAGGPPKVQANAPAVVLPPSSVLDKGATDKPAQAKVVNNEEQPVDLSLQPKSPPPAPVHPAASAPPAVTAPAVTRAPPAPAAPPPVAAAPPAPPSVASVAVSASDHGSDPAAAASAARSVTAAPKPSIASIIEATSRATPMAAAGAPVILAPPEPSYPQPKRVRVVSVRADGSIIGSDATGAADTPAPAGPGLSASLSPAPSSAPLAGSAAVDSTPTGVTGTAAEEPVPADVPIPRPRPSKLNPRARARAVADAAEETPATARSAHGTARAPQPTDPADTDTDATASGGNYAVQLAAAPSEEEARSTMQHLQRKYGSELSGHRSTFHRVRVGEKTVYRVRVGNLSKDEAADLCSKLQANGGSCFIAVQN